MFHTITQKMLKRMQYLESIDYRDRQDNTPRMQRLRQVPPETGKFIAMLAASAPEGEYIEIGTSAGYSTMWLSLACRAVGKTITTYEILDEKVQLARETFAETEITDVVQLIHGDALELLDEVHDISFCFLDAEKDIYHALYDKVVPKMVKGGILVADNAINHQAILKPMLENALSDSRVDALIVPLKNGELVCRKI